MPNSYPLSPSTLSPIDGALSQVTADAVRGAVVPGNQVLLSAFKLAGDPDYTNALARAQTYLIDNYNGGVVLLPPEVVYADALLLRRNIFIEGGVLVPTSASSKRGYQRPLCHAVRQQRL